MAVGLVEGVGVRVLLVVGVGLGLGGGVPPGDGVGLGVGVKVIVLVGVSVDVAVGVAFFLFGVRVQVHSRRGWPLGRVTGDEDGCIEVLAGSIRIEGDINLQDVILAALFLARDCDLSACWSKLRRRCDE